MTTRPSRMRTWPRLWAPTMVRPWVRDIRCLHSGAETTPSCTVWPASADSSKSPAASTLSTFPCRDRGRLEIVTRDVLLHRTNLRKKDESQTYQKLLWNSYLGSCSRSHCPRSQRELKFELRNSIFFVYSICLENKTFKTVLSAVEGVCLGLNHSRKYYKSFFEIYYRYYCHDGVCQDPISLYHQHFISISLYHHP